MGFLVGRITSATREIPLTRRHAASYTRVCPAVIMTVSCFQVGTLMGNRTVMNS